MAVVGRAVLFGMMALLFWRYVRGDGPPASTSAERRTVWASGLDSSFVTQSLLLLIVAAATLFTVTRLVKVCREADLGGRE